MIDFIDHLLEWSRAVPIYVVTLSRPELLERKADWGAGKRNFTSLYLEPLSAAAMRELLAGLVPGLPSGAVKAIVERADGIPLYAVETVRMLLAEGKLALEDGAYRPIGDLANLAVPETLTALIASRLDGLAAEDRALVSDAAVLGQSFTLAALSSVSGIADAELEPRLRALVRRELLTLEADPRSPERGQYAFVQALIREVAYNTLAKRDRKTRHLAAARFFEALGSDELAGALASHYLAAQQNAAQGPEADTLAAQARIALRAAADRAIGLGSLGQAIGFLDQARAVTDDDAENAELLERAGESAYLAGLGEICEDRLRRAIEIRRVLGDTDAVAGAIAMLGALLLATFRVGAGLAMLEPAAGELLGDDGVPTGRGGVALLAQLSRAYFFNEGQRRAIEVADRALEAGERLDLAPIVSDVLITRGSALCHIGRVYEGLGAIRAGIELADERGLVSTALRGRLNLGVLAPDPRTSFDATQAALEIARRVGLRGYVRTLVGNLASAAMEVGEWELAVREITVARDESPDELAANFMRWVLVNFSAWRGDDVASELAYLSAWAESIGESGPREAIQDLRAQVAFGTANFGGACDAWLVFAPSDSLNAPTAYFYAGMAGLLAADRDRAAAALAGLEALPGRSRLWTLDRRLLGAGLAAIDGRQSESIREVRAVLGEYAAMGLPWREALGGLVLTSLVGAVETELREMADTARATFSRLGAKPFVAYLDAALASSANQASEPKPGSQRADATQQVLNR